MTHLSWEDKYHEGQEVLAESTGRLVAGVD